MERFTPTQKQEAQKYGGSEVENWADYLKIPDPPYCNKSDHMLRSMSNDNGQHQDFWRKNGR